MAAAAGLVHSAAVGEDGSLFVWGSGAKGQLGTGDTASRLAPTRVAGLPAPVRQVAAGRYHTGIVTEAGDLLMCGYGSDGFMCGITSRKLFSRISIFRLAYRPGHHVSDAASCAA